jgi:hypothetical protein
MREPHKWYSDGTIESPWLRALAEVRHRAPRVGCCYQRVQAIIIVVYQLAEAATRNREFFLNKPHSIGGRREDGISS